MTLYTISEPRWDAPCNSITTSKTVTVTANPVAGAISADQTICEGDLPSAVSISGTLGNIEFWEIDTNASFSNPVAFGSGVELCKWLSTWCHNADILCACYYFKWGLLR